MKFHHPPIKHSLYNNVSTTYNNRSRMTSSCSRLSFEIIPSRRKSERPRSRPCHLSTTSRLSRPDHGRTKYFGTNSSHGYTMTYLSCDTHYMTRSQDRNKHHHRATRYFAWTTLFNLCYLVRTLLDTHQL